HPAPPDDDECDDLAFKQRCESETESLKERLERETRLWADLVEVDPLEAVEFSGEVDPWRIDAELKRFIDMRNRWDEVFGLVALERALVRIPLLRQALREKRISYEKARLIARHWETGQVNEVRPLIAMAERMTCVELREALTAKSEEQMCARGAFTVTAPPDVFELLKQTLRMARALAKR